MVGWLALEGTGKLSYGSFGCVALSSSSAFDFLEVTDLVLQEPKLVEGASKVTPPTHKLIASLDSAHGVHDVNAVVWCPRSGFEDLMATTGDDGLAKVWKVVPGP